MTTSGPDTDLFAVFANAEARMVIEALLQKPAKQSGLVVDLQLKKSAVSGAVKRLETAGLADRSSPRGDIRLMHFDAIAALLEAEASLSEEAQKLKTEKARRRSRQIRKSRMQGGVHGRRADSKKSER